MRLSAPPFVVVVVVVVEALKLSSRRDLEIVISSLFATCRPMYRCIGGHSSFSASRRDPGWGFQELLKKALTHRSPVI